MCLFLLTTQKNLSSNECKRKRTPKKSDVLVYGEEFARKALAMPNSFRVCAFAFACDGKEFGTFMQRIIMKLQQVSGPRSTRLSRERENMELRRAADRREAARIADAVANAVEIKYR